jgi:queuine tRNA-ribosyltransferase
MRNMRAHILAGTWLEFYRAQRDVLDARDSYGPPVTHVTKAQRRKLAERRGRYEVVVRDGVGHIRDTVSGEVMHSVNDPEAEARGLYVGPARVVERLQGGETAPLVIWDVGLGAAANAMATIAAVERFLPTPESRSPTGVAAAAPPSRPLLLVSFENDLDSLLLALRQIHAFPYLRHPAPHRLVEKHHWHSACAPIEWRLLLGDFATLKFSAPPPDIVYFDPFSFKTDGGLWSLAAFRELAGICVGSATELFTYSYSTSVRAAMLAAGFYVAKGSPTGPKAETTVALSPLAVARGHAHELLGEEWLLKWRRSDARVPLGADPEDSSWQEAIAAHPQFRR